MCGCADASTASAEIFSAAVFPPLSAGVELYLPLMNRERLKENILVFLSANYSNCICLSISPPIRNAIKDMRFSRLLFKIAANSLSNEHPAKSALIVVVILIDIFSNFLL